MPNDGHPPSRPDGTNHGISRNSRTTPKNVQTTIDTMHEAAQLRAAGATFREIGKTLDIDPTWARTLVLRALEAAEYEAADLLRTQEGMRLDRLQRAFWPRALNGEVAAAKLILQVMDRRARLFGLDAPVAVEAAVTMTDPTSLDAELAAVEAAVKASSTTG